ncbi:unnamed protein product [Prorocentrum cordatum]|uniref:Uncharacterized protein n=1 Tax=Prorocentrum cordatum TaxID=2364126 RepID=A0ABN9T701_9DINO|nr:unnamed protein product [Polarella glacialis]
MASGAAPAVPCPRAAALVGLRRRRLVAPLAAAAAALGAAALWPLGHAAAPAAAWAGASALLPLVGQRGAAAPARSRTALGAVQTRGGKAKTGATKKGKYRGPVNPRLRAFMGSSEYREMIQLLSGLNEQGLLDGFLDKAGAYWGSMNIFRLAELERSKGGQGVMTTLRQDWPRIWPKELEEGRFAAFDKFQRYWGRLERSKLVDDVMKDVLPDMEKGYDNPEASKDYKKLKDMTDEQRSDEILRRIGKNELVRQYVILSETDPEVSSIGSKMMPFIAGCVSALERKVATETAEMAETLDQGLIVAGGAALVLIVLFATGVIPSPIEILGAIWNFKV